MLAVFATALMMSIVVIALCVGVIYGVVSVLKWRRDVRKRRRRATWPRGTFGAA